MRKKIILFLLFAPGFFLAQNLVPNGDFEENIKIPDSFNQLQYLKGWKNVTLDSLASRSSADYYHTSGYYINCFGAIMPFSGKAQVGMSIYSSKNFREYISAKLNHPLVKEKEYAVSFYLSNGKGNAFTYTCANFGILFSADSLNTQSKKTISIEPQLEIKELIVIDNGWKKISFSYIAEDEMNYITLGNFRSNDNTIISESGMGGAYYFIDKVEVAPLQKSKTEIVAKTKNKSIESMRSASDNLKMKYDTSSDKAKNNPEKEK